MPWLSSPRILAAWMMSPFGMIVPMVASGTIIPAVTFGAPHTMRSSPAPPLTRQSLSLSALGCLFASSTSATTMPG